MGFGMADHRDTAHRRHRESIVVEDEDGLEHELPTTWVVCPTCDGRGSYVNPSIDAHGITSDEWAEWDHEEQDIYTSGGYDVTCEECRGRTTVLAVDEKRCSKKLLEIYRDQQEDLSNMYAEMDAERRFGA